MTRARWSIAFIGLIRMLVQINTLSFDGGIHLLAVALSCWIEGEPLKLASLIRWEIVMQRLLRGSLAHVAALSSLPVFA